MPVVNNQAAPSARLHLALVEDEPKSNFHALVYKTFAVAATAFTYWNFGLVPAVGVAVAAVVLYKCFNYGERNCEGRQQNNANMQPEIRKQALNMRRQTFDTSDSDTNNTSPRWDRKRESPQVRIPPRQERGFRGQEADPIPRGHRRLSTPFPSQGFGNGRRREELERDLLRDRVGVIPGSGLNRPAQPLQPTAPQRRDNGIRDLEGRGVIPGSGRHRQAQPLQPSAQQDRDNGIRDLEGRGVIPGSGRHRQAQPLQPSAQQDRDNGIRDLEGRGVIPGSGRHRQAQPLQPSAQQDRDNGIRDLEGRGVIPGSGRHRQAQPLQSSAQQDRDNGIRDPEGRGVIPGSGRRRTRT